MFVGDFNLPYVDWMMLNAPNSPQYVPFLDFVNYVGLSQLVLEPTRLQNVLDLALTTDMLFISSVMVIDSFGMVVTILQCPFMYSVLSMSRSVHL